MNQGLMIREGHIVDDEELDALKSEVRQLKAALQQANSDLAVARRESTRALSALRKQLSPLYRALQDVFGELDAAGVDETATTASRDEWDEWKRRLGPSCAKVIDALLLGGEMSVKAIVTTAKMGQQTVYDSTSKMGRAGILVRNGGKFSLRNTAK